MNIPHQAGPQPSFPVADQQSPGERDEEARKIRRARN
jgi:hypothetical protein